EQPFPKPYARLWYASAFFLVFAATLCSKNGWAAASNPGFVELTKPAEPAIRMADDRNGYVQTQEGMTLHLTTDLGSVKIVPLEPGAAPVVRYHVHIETDARAPLAQHLLAHYSFTAKATPSGVELSGALPPQLSHSDAGTQFWVQFEVAVPSTYSIE